MYGGATKSFLCLLKSVVENGSDVLVITPDRNGVYNYLVDNGIKVQALRYFFNTSPVDKREYIKSILKQIINFYSSIKLFLLALHFKPNIIHSNTSVIHIGYHVAKWMHIPHIWHIREYGDKDFNLNIRGIPERLTAESNYSISITRDIARHRNVLNCNTNKVIYNGIVQDSCVSADIKREDYFLYAGRIERVKGIEDCVRAFIQFKKDTDSDTKLYIAGELTIKDKDLKSVLEKNIIDNNLLGEVRWLGARNDIDYLMQHAKAIIIPSIYEGFGRVMSEAMSNRCIVIGRDTGGTHEQFENGIKITGSEIGFPFNNIDGLVSCLKKVLHMTEAQLESIRDNAEKTVYTLYTPKKYCSDIQDFYRMVLSR